MKPLVTRLRYVSSKEPGMLQAFLARLNMRVQIYSINWDGKKWVLWFVPPDDVHKDVQSADLD